MHASGTIRKRAISRFLHSDDLLRVCSDARAWISSIVSTPELDEVMNVQPAKGNVAKSYQLKQFLKLIDAHHLQLVEDESDEQ